MSNIWTDYKQYLPLESPKCCRDFFARPFSPVPKNTCFFPSGATMVRHVSPKFATTFQLTFYLGQTTLLFFKNDQYITSTQEPTSIFFHKLLGNNLLHIFIPCVKIFAPKNSAARRLSLVKNQLRDSHSRHRRYEVATLARAWEAIRLAWIVRRWIFKNLVLGGL